MKTEQVINKNKLLLLLALLAAFPPLSTDMYLPAIPLLQANWQVSLEVVNLTLVGFFVSYCICLLFYGPLADRFGRRPPLLAGIGLFILASLMCALVDNVASLIAFRVLQAAGAASASVLALAISKDVYLGHERERALAYMGVIMALAPMLKAQLEKSRASFADVHADLPLAVPIGLASELRAWTRRTFLEFRELELRLLLEKLRTALPGLMPFK